MSPLHCSTVREALWERAASPGPAPLSPALAVEEIGRCSGTQFDPECVGLLGQVLVDAMEKEILDAAV